MWGKKVRVEVLKPDKIFSFVRECRRVMEYMLVQSPSEQRIQICLELAASIGLNTLSWRSNGCTINDIEKLLDGHTELYTTFLDEKLLSEADVQKAHHFLTECEASFKIVFQTLYKEQQQRLR